MKTQKRILIVEDDWYIANQTKKTLESLGYIVPDIVATGEQAIETVRVDPPDLILMDIVLKGEIDGIDSAIEINKTKNIPIVYVTAYAEYELLERVKVTGPYGYLTKPFKKEELHTSVEIALYKHEMEKRLAESELKFKTMFEKAPLSYQSLDENGNFTEVNETWLKIMGYDRKEVLGKNFSEFLLPEWEAHFAENFPRFKAIGEILGVEFEMIKKDGSVILVSFHGKIAKNEQGGFQRTHCVFSDITKQKSVENQLETELELNKAIAKISRELLSETYDIKKVSDIILKYSLALTNSEHGFVSSIDFNTLENVGHTLTEMFGKQCRVKDQRIAFPIGPDGKYNALWGHALNTKQAFYTNSPMDHQKSRGLPEGHIPLKNYMAVPVVVEDKLLGLIALANSDRDYSKSDIMHIQRISETFALALRRQQYEAERESMEKSLRQLQKNEAIGALAGGIAHDFNNILFPIVGFAELLAEDISKENPLRESVNEILAGAKRAKELVNQILTFSRQTEKELKPVRPHLIIREVIKLVKATIPSTIEIKQKINKDCRTIMADPTQIHQIAMNLITNAYHAMSESGGILSINLKNIDVDDDMPILGLGSGPYILFSVEDDGMGMDQLTLDKIFDPYFTTKPKDKGTGLGLSVVHGIVKNYGGEIEVKTEPGDGSVFNIYLPGFESDAVQEEELNIEEDFSGNERILLVDDELPVLKLEQRVLERLGYEIEFTDHSEIALEMVQSNPEKYDLIISDMTMPKMSGDVLVQKIKKINPDLPVIICTGFSERLSPERAHSIGVNEILVKPIIKRTLAQTVRNILDE